MKTYSAKEAAEYLNIRTQDLRARLYKNGFVDSEMIPTIESIWNSYMVKTRDREAKGKYFALRITETGMKEIIRLKLHHKDDRSAFECVKCGKKKERYQIDRAYKNKPGVKPVCKTCAAVSQADRLMWEAFKPKVNGVYEGFW